MKKLFFSLLLGTIIAICWVLVIQTLKWIAIKGNEYEMLTMVQQQRANQLQYLRQPAASDPGAPFAGPTLESSGDISEDQSQLSSNKTQSSNTTQPETGTASSLARIIRRRQDVAESANSDAAHESEDTAQSSPVIERQVHPHKRVLHLSSIATQRQRPQQQQQQPSHKTSAGRESDELSVESTADDQLDREANDGDELIQLPSQTEDRPGSSVHRETDPYLYQEQLGNDQPSKVASLIYRAPFFTTWFISIWNILFMPVFALISSCCFRNEDNTTKKLLV